MLSEVFISEHLDYQNLRNPASNMQIKEEWIDDESSSCFDDVLDGNRELFPGLSLPCDELCAELEDVDLIFTRESRELRNHDCMWAGVCHSEKHDSVLRHERVAKPATATATAKRPARVVAPTSARSLLLPTITPQPRPPTRPDTPLSENELDVEFGQFGELLEDLPSVVPSDVTGQLPCKTETFAPNTDHCYYTMPTPPQEHAVHTDSLGVQTPSDSEEEIDVETIPDRKPYRCVQSPVTINGSAGSMPTTPTAEDKIELQRTVKAIVCARGRPPLGYERRKRKRRLSSGDFTGEYVRKAVKRKQYRKMQSKVMKRRRRHVVRTSSSDSEMESTERRSIHNNLERQRRVHLRNAYEDLRILLPDTVDNEKAAKVTILSCGAHYCQQLEQREEMMVMEIEALKKHQDRLRDQLSCLRRSLAKRR